MEAEGTQNGGLALVGQRYRKYETVLVALKGDPATEYLDGADLDDMLWHLACEIAVARDRPRVTDAVLARVDEFIGAVAKPIVDFEILFVVEHLQVQGPPIRLLDAEILTFSRENLRRWARDQEEVEGEGDKSFVRVRGRGTNPQRAAARARAEAELALDLLRLGAHTHRQFREEEMRFVLGSVTFAKSDGQLWLDWDHQRAPINLQLAPETFNQFSRNLEGPIGLLVGSQVDAGLKESFNIALRRLREALKSKEPDQKVAHVFTGMEALLADKGDSKKAEALACRFALLSEAVGEGFQNPEWIFMMYDDRRSFTEHGAGYALSTKDEARRLQNYLADTIGRYAVLVEREQLRSRRDVLHYLHQPARATGLVKWLEARGSAKSLRLAQWLEQPAAGAESRLRQESPR